MATRDDDTNLLPDPPEMRLDLALDGVEVAELPPLDAVAADPALARERRRLERLHGELAAARVSARPGFAQAVMASLPPNPAWAQRRVGGLRGAVAALLALAAAATLLLGAGSARLGAAGAALGAARAVADFAVAATLSGAGLLAASWRGVGMALGAALDVPERVVFGLGVIGLNALLFLLLRRRSGRRRATAAAMARRPER
jgi:hypothetical protein